ncbi:solute carrier family 13 member 4-like [Liolophura sinensis]|uniref:solute carrier family 13 member 4-like n=1 Tax=Liolophura sinensis TaxID=3198878 RepID=UPI003158BCD4
MKIKKVLLTILDMKTVIMSILTPILLLPILYEVEGDAGRCGYGVGIVIVFWAFEILPLGVTALLPILLFPVLGVLTTGQVSGEYIKSPSVTLIGIFGIIAAVERWGLHNRIALGILKLFGTKPHWLILGMMVCTAVLSIFITAGVTVLMIPIVRSVVDRLEGVQSTRERKTEENENSEDEENDSGATITDSEHQDEVKRLYKAFSLCISHGTSIGSTTILTGHPSNFVSLALIEQGLCRRSRMTAEMENAEKRLKEYLRDEYKKLGSVTYPEILVMIMMLSMMILFITEDLYFTKGWDSWFKPGFVGAAGPAILILTLMFIIPAKSPLELLRRKGKDKSNNRFAPLLSWSDVNKSLPWYIILLIGAGFAVTKACEVSGLMDLVQETFSEIFSGMELWVLTLVVTTIVIFLTEIISSTATLVTLLPIVSELAIQAGHDPLALAFPMAISTNFAFMMPISTPPNAIAYSLGSLKIKDMVGILMKARPSDVPLRGRGILGL